RAERARGDQDRRVDQPARHHPDAQHAGRGRPRGLQQRSGDRMRRQEEDARRREQDDQPLIGKASSTTSVSPVKSGNSMWPIMVSAEPRSAELNSTQPKITRTMVSMRRSARATGLAGASARPKLRSMISS